MRSLGHIFGNITVTIIGPKHTVAIMGPQCILSCPYLIIMIVKKKHIQGGRYRRPNIAGKTYAIYRCLAKILSVPISPKFYEIYITNYFVGVMNDVIRMT